MELSEAENPALLYSGGKESSLLLDRVLKERPNTTLVHFYDQLRPKIKQVIADKKIQVLSWKPATRYFIPWDDSLVLVSEYSFGCARLPVLKDITIGGECEVE